MHANAGDNILSLAHSCGIDAILAPRLYQEVSQAARVFDLPEPPRPSKILSELRSLEARLLSKTAAIPRPPEHLWPCLFVAEEHELELLLDNKDGLLRAVQDGLQALETASELDHSRKGGRHRDPRLDQFVMRLALIYRRYAKKNETFTINWDTGKPDSAFSEFVTEAIRQFHPANRVPPGTLRTAMQIVARFLRNTETLSPEELDTLFGVSSSPTE